MGVKQPAADRPEPGTGRAVPGCWCGGADLEPLGSDYGCCQRCGTVVYRQPISNAEYLAADGTGFYGDRYWRRHVPRVLGLPGLEERARADLSERAVFHLVKILDYLAPGARVLELGCGAGSLTYLLRQAGFDAAGLELGPAAIELARDHFGVEVHRGPLEALADDRPFDAIVGVDVLEHLPDPLATITLCARRLNPGGLLFLQTPCYRDEGPEWQMLLPREHLYLFNEASVERLLRQAGFAAVEIGRSLFAYDMWVAAALVALDRRPEPMAGVPPVVVGLIDATAAGTRAHDERDAVDADRKLKESDVETLRRELETLRDDQQAKEQVLSRQDRELRQVRKDQERRVGLISRLNGELEAVRADQAARGELIDRLGGELAALRRDRQEKGEQVDRLSLELESARADQASKEELIDRLSVELELVRGDQAVKAELIDRLSVELEMVRGDQQAKERLIRRLDGELEANAVALEQSRAELGRARAEIEDIQADRLYRLLRAARARLGGRP